MLLVLLVLLVLFYIPFLKVVLLYGLELVVRFLVDGYYVMEIIVLQI